MQLKSLKNVKAEDGYNQIPQDQLSEFMFLNHVRQLQTLSWEVVSLSQGTSQNPLSYSTSESHILPNTTAVNLVTYTGQEYLEDEESNKEKEL